MNGYGSGNGQELSREDYAGLLIDRLAAAIVDDSLPLKEVERELRGSVAEVAVHRRGLDKRETASRCGVTEKSIENYLKEVRKNPKSPEREIARVLQDKMLTLEEVYEEVRPVISPARTFTLDDAKRALDKLIRTGEIQEYPGHKYRAVDRPAIRYPTTLEAHRELVDQKARDLDYIVLCQKEAGEDEILNRRSQRFSRVVGDTNLVRIDFTAKVDDNQIEEFYEKLSSEIAKLTMKYEKKNGALRMRLLLGMRSVTAVVCLALAFFLVFSFGASPECIGSWELDRIVQRAAGDPPPSEDPQEDQHGAPQDSTVGADPDSPAPDALDPEDGERDEDVPDDSVRDEGEGFVLLRGDVNLSSQVELTDAILLTAFLFDEEVQEIPCHLAADVNGDNQITLFDPYLLFMYLYADTPNLCDYEPEPVLPEDDQGLGCDGLSEFRAV